MLFTNSDIAGAPGGNIERSDEGIASIFESTFGQWSVVGRSEALYSRTLGMVCEDSGLS